MMFFEMVLGWFGSGEAPPTVPFIEPGTCLRVPSGRQQFRSAVSRLHFRAD